MTFELIANLLFIIIPLIEVAGIITAGHAVFHTRTAQGAVAWAISLVTFPYISLPLYWIFGRRKFHGNIKLRMSDDQKIHHFFHELQNDARQKNLRAEKLSTPWQAFTELAEMPITRHNNAQLLINGERTFQAIFQGIENAGDYILLQFYIIRDDNLGRRIRDLLIQQASRGIRIFVLYDEIGCYALPDSYIASLRRAGVHVNPFLTTRGRFNRFQLNFRNHRKIVIVDGKEAFVGGHNIGDEYMGKNRRFGAWRDTHVWVQGPMVQCIQLRFVEDWHWATRNVPKLNWALAPVSDAAIRSLVLASGPADRLETCGLFFLHAIQSAQRRIWIASPYFVPDPAIISALQLAALRGVDVRILVPRKPDHLLVYWASFSYYPEILPLGISIYRYTSGFMHQKVMLVDDAVASVGTANLDNRSFRLNFEMSLLFHSRQFGEEVEKMLLDDFSQSRRVSIQDYEKRSIFFKLAVHFSRLMSPLL